MTRVSVKIYGHRYEVIESKAGEEFNTLHKSGTFKTAQRMWDDMRKRCKDNNWKVYTIGHVK